MKFKALSIYPKTGKVTSMHAIYGCKEAKQCNFTDDQGRLRNVISVPAFGGAILLPCVEKVTTLTYRSMTADIFTNGTLFFGKINNINAYMSFYGKDLNSAEQKFQATVEKFLQSQISADADDLAHALHY